MFKVLLEKDHTEVDQLYNEVVGRLDAGSSEEVLERLDLFWARLAVHIRAEHLQACAVIPFLIDDQILDCVKFHFDGPRPLADEDTVLLSAIAQQCAQQHLLAQRFLVVRLTHGRVRCSTAWSKPAQIGPLPSAMAVPTATPVCRMPAKNARL